MSKQHQQVCPKTQCEYSHSRWNIFAIFKFSPKMSELIHVPKRHYSRLHHSDLQLLSFSNILQPMKINLKSVQNLLLILLKQKQNLGGYIPISQQEKVKQKPLSIFTFFPHSFHPKVAIGQNSQKAENWKNRKTIITFSKQLQLLSIFFQVL